MQLPERRPTTAPNHQSLREVDEPFTGADDLVRLDGMAGFLAVVEHVGRALIADPNAWIDDSQLEIPNQVCGKSRCEKRFSTHMGEGAVRLAGWLARDIQRSR